MALSAKDLFFGVKNPLWTKFKTVLTDERRKTLEKGGQRIIGFGELLNVPRMIATGFNVNQPGMLLGGLLKIVSSMCMLFAKNEKSRLFAWLIDALTGVIYSVGYDNEIKNQDPTLTDPIRRYDMHAMLNRLKAPFTPGNGLLWHQRLLGAVGNPVREMGKLLWFFLGDNVAIVKDLWRTRLFLKPENRYPVQERANFKQKRKDAAKASWRQRFVNWAKNPSLSKSELAASLGWLGAIPALTAAILKKENLSNHPIIVALRAMTLTAENMPTLSIAMNRQDLPGRMPLVGFPLLLFLTHYGRTINLGLGNLGGGINEFYFSDVALHGVRAHEKKTQKNES